MRAVLDADPVATCMVAARVEVAGLDPWRLGGEMWAFGSRLDGLCFSGANLVPLRGERAALRSFADRARRHGRSCSSIVGRAELVLPLWDDLSEHWAPPREVRADQPLMVLAGAPGGRARTRSCARCGIERARPLPAGGDRDVHRGGRASTRGGRRRGRLPGPGRGAGPGRPRLRPLRGRRGGLQGRDRGADRAGRADPGRLGAPGPPRPRPGHDRARRRSTDRLAAMGRVSSLYVNGFNTWRGGRTPGSASGRSAASRRCCSRNPVLDASTASDTPGCGVSTAFLSDPVGILASVSRLPAVNPPRSRRLAASALRTRVGIAALALC